MTGWHHFVIVPYMERGLEQAERTRNDHTQSKDPARTQQEGGSL